MRSGSTRPSVTVAVPVLNEERHIEACLEAIAAQTYSNIVEVLVIDGGSSDRTREVAARAGVALLENPRRIQAAALNIALDAAKGDVFVRVDGHCRIAPDYVERCVQALDRTGAAMVGGGMTPIADGWMQQGIAAALSSSVGAGPARFHVGGEAGWVDTVYLGAYRVADARLACGYAEDVGVNEDAEFAIRLGANGGVWFDPSIRSTYMPRGNLTALARQFFRYGRSRAATVRKHPSSLAARQLAAPLLVIGLLSRRRRLVTVAYTALVGVKAAEIARQDGSVGAGFALALPVIHVSWGIGFLVGLVRQRSR